MNCPSYLVIEMSFEEMNIESVAATFSSPIPSSSAGWISKDVVCRLSPVAASTAATALQLHLEVEVEALYTGGR
jgi:hypothetical protein